MSFFFRKRKTDESKKPEVQSRSLNKREALFVEKSMTHVIDKFTLPHKVSIFCGTYNLNAKPMTKGESLATWLMPGKMNETHDIYAIGFQEAVDLSTNNVVFSDAKSNDRSQYWNQELHDFLSKSGRKYEIVESISLVGILLYVFAADEIRKEIQDIRKSSAGTGMMGVMGNKGGVSVRFNLFDSSICFVNSHLSSGASKNDMRQLDFENINEKCMFLGNPNQISDTSCPWRRNAKSYEEDKLIEDHSHVFWIGDLNYRMVANTQEEVFDLTFAGDIKTLLTRDMLNMEKNEKKTVFQGYNEGEITFLPTYKFTPGTNNYENRPDKKIRAPAFCDRVLWKTTCEESVKQRSYDRAMLTPSDHKPVFATFEVTLCKIDQAKERTMLGDTYREIDKWVNANAPKLKIQGAPEITFRAAVAGVEQSGSISIANEGSTAAEWEFINPAGAEKSGPAWPICPKWLKIPTSHDFILPGQVRYHCSRLALTRAQRRD
jgi:phosphatidylinositol-bisphosphatase